MQLAKLVCRNAFRHPLRASLTILAVAVAVLAFGLLRTVVASWYAGVNASSASRLVTRNAISLVFSLPVSYTQRIRSVPGVKGVAAGAWFGGVYLEPKNFIPNFAVEPKPYLDLYPEYLLSEEEKKAFYLDRMGCVVGRKTAQRFGWKVGDRITLKGTIYPGDWGMVIRGIYRGADRTIDETQLLFHWDYLNESLRATAPRRADQAGFYVIGVTDPELAAEVAGRVDATFRNSLAETLTETEKAFQLSFVSMTEAIVVAIRIVSLLVIVIIMAVAANTMAMTARERVAEHAVFKTLGFRPPYIVAMILGESLVIAMSGCIIGLFLTFPAARAFGKAMGPFLPVFIVENDTILLDIAAGLVVAAVAAVFPAWHAVRVGIADGLRRIG